jgi:hypothetical protein
VLASSSMRVGSAVEYWRELVPEFVMVSPS